MIASRSDQIAFDPVPLGRGSAFWFAAAMIAVTVGVAGCVTLGAGHLSDSIDSAVATSVLGLGLLGVMVRRLRFAAAMAALPALLGFWSLALGSSVGAPAPRAILAFLSPDAVGPMGTQTAVMLSCIGLSLQLSAQRAPRLWARAVAWALVVVALMVPCVVLIGYAIGTPGLVAWDGAVRTPLPLLLTLLVLALTLLFSPLHAPRAPAVRWVPVLSAIAVVAGLTGSLWLEAQRIESQRAASDVDNIADLASRIVDSQAATRTRALAGLAEMLSASDQAVGSETGALLTWYGLQNPGLLGLLEYRDGEWRALLAPSQERIDALLRGRSLASVREATSLAPGEHGARFSLIPGEAGEPLVGLIQRYIGAQGDGRLLLALWDGAAVDRYLFARVPDAYSVSLRMGGIPLTKRGQGPAVMLEALTIPVPSLGPDFALEVGMTADAHALHGTGLPRFVLLAGAIALALALMAIELTDALRARATHAERLLHSLREQQNRRKADEAALRRSRAETHSIVESLGDGILTVAPDWTVLAANSALRDLLGRDVAAMVGRNLWRSMPELADTDVETALRQAHAECAETRFAMDSPDDARHMAVRAHPHFGGLAIHFRDVTEERAATQRLAQSEALLALSQEIAQLGSWFESAVDHRVSWSDQTYRIHGVDPAHFQPSLEAELVLIRPEDRQRVSEAREALRGNGAPIDLTYCIVRADGSERRLRLLGEALLDDQQRRLGVHGSIQDVTDQARVEERLQRSLQLLSSAEEIAGFGSWEFEFATQLMHWSHNTYRIHCVDPETYQPRMFGATEKVHVDDRQALREARDQALIKLRPFKVQYRLAGPDGKERRLQAVGRPRVDESGKPVALLGTVQDITEIHLAEQELRRNLELLELSQDIAEMGSWELDPATGRVGWSRQTYIIHGLDPDHPAIKPEESARLIHPGDRERVLSERNQLVALSWPGEAHYRIVRPDGEIRLLHVRGRPHIDKSGSMALMHGTVQDVTERYRMEQALRRSIVDLDSRNRDLREFTQIASHDLQEPLRKIQVFAGLLDQRMKAEATDPAAIRDYVERMAATAERMQWLLADLLAYSLNDSAALRVEEVLPEQILAVAKRNAEEALASCAGRIAIQVDEAAPAIRTDPVLLRQILDNLIGNAVKYRDAARPLAIRIELGARNGSSSDSTPAGWRLTVADNGIGFEPRHAERIFAPFQRLHDRQQYPGTGMGLTLVRRMAERLAGSVHAEGRPGEGATFIVEIADLPAGEDIAGSPEARWQSYFEAQYSASAGDDRQPHPPEDFDGRAV